MKHKSSINSSSSSSSSSSFNNYFSNGVSINPSHPTSQNLTTITYNGILAQSGASEIYARVGFGNNWESTHEYKMARTSNGFEVSLPPSGHNNTLNVCFKDGANNWDNNSGSNYSFPVKKHDVNYSLDYETEVSMRRS